jgi:hypothetical protein
MRSAWFVLCSVSLLAACGTEPDTTTLPVEVNWMEWPAEVKTGAPVTVRLIGYEPCASIIALRTPALVDNSAVTLEPYFLMKNDYVLCPAAASAANAVSIVAFGFDTTTVVPGLQADLDRTYDMRAAASVYNAPQLAALPVRTFGTITVRVGQPDASHTLAAGFAYEYKDLGGCVRLQPFGAYLGGSGYVVENADTVSALGGMVRGYLYQPAAPLCGASKVFHLVSVN